MPRVYLLTLAHAEKAPDLSKRAFAERVEQSFRACYGNVVEYWCVSSEPHQEGGFHYHMSLKLKRSLRFSGPRKELSDVPLRLTQQRSCCQETVSLVFFFAHCSQKARGTNGAQVVLYGAQHGAQQF